MTGVKHKARANTDQHPAGGAQQKLECQRMPISQRIAENLLWPNLRWQATSQEAAEAEVEVGVKGEYAFGSFWPRRCPGDPGGRPSAQFGCQEGRRRVA